MKSDGKGWNTGLFGVGYRHEMGDIRGIWYKIPVTGPALTPRNRRQKHEL